MSVLFYLVIGYLVNVSYGEPGTSRWSIVSKRARIGEFPYMISLRRYGRHHCGGSIITRRHILTAAHCISFVNSEKFLSVHAGTNFLNETGDRYTVAKVISHSNYTIDTYANDIGLLHLKKDVQFKSTVRQIHLPTTEVTKTGDPCTLCGWSVLNIWDELPNDLQKLNLRVFPQTECDKVWNQSGGIIDSQICAFSENGQGAYSGDSGSPLVFKNIQIGIASFIRPFAFGIPDVYTRVSAFKEWIDKHTEL